MNLKSLEDGDRDSPKVLRASLKRLNLQELEQHFFDKRHCWVMENKLSQVLYDQFQCVLTLIPIQMQHLWIYH